MEAGKEVICVGLKVIAEVEEVIFPVSLIGAIVTNLRS